MSGTGYLINNLVGQSVDVFILPPVPDAEFKITGVLTNVVYSSTSQVDYLVLDDLRIIPLSASYCVKLAS